MNERILLGVTGSIAAYKAPFILRRLNQRGFRVPVVLTESALRFIGRVTFEALTKYGVYDNLWARRQALSHISLLEDTKLILLAPATANIIAKCANGLADDLLSSLLLAANPELVVIAPAMNTGMWNNPATQANISLLKQRGVQFIEPSSGELACGVVGKGRLVNIEELILNVEGMVRACPLISGKKVLVTAGRTEEELDPVRVLTNRSSGRMGVEIARAFARAGACVTLLAGQISVPLPEGIHTIRTYSAEQMLNQLKMIMSETDILIMAAAIADYRLQLPADDKIKDSSFSLNLTKTPDILSALSNFSAIRIGFSVETSSNWESLALKKLSSKKLNAIVANPADVIDSKETRAVIFYSNGKKLEIPQSSKKELALKLVQVTAELLEEREVNGS